MGTNFFEYVQNNYKLKSLNDLFYNGCGCSWNSDLNGKRYNYLKLSDIQKGTPGTTWFTFDSIFYDKISIEEIRRYVTIKDEKKSETNFTSVSSNTDDDTFINESDNFTENVIAAAIFFGI